MNYDDIDILTPKLYRNYFPYSEIPKVKFNNIQLPMDIPEDIWITDTTFRDGQQSMSDMTVEQIVRIFDYLHKLDNGSGIIRQTEFFLYSEKDRKAVKECMKRGYEFPEITSWIRANKEDFKLVKDMGIKETGILMSCSDYHIFHKLNMTRSEAMKSYLEIAEAALQNEIIPRCHFEDITRADFFGFVVPLAKGIMDLSDKYNMPIKIRGCDTLGLGSPYAGVELPRSIPAIIHGLRYYCDVPSSFIEWHGHNDFNNVVVNSTTSWLYGGASVNTTLFGIGERTGNCPLEAMLFEYAQIKGTSKSLNLKILFEIADYFEKEFGYIVPPRTPFIGSEFNITKAGIHADGMLKNKEIYNSFDTEKFLGKPPEIAINSYSGLAGIAAWINYYLKEDINEEIDKRDKRIIPIKKWIDDEYTGGRTSNVSDNELKKLVTKFIPEILENKNK